MICTFEENFVTMVTRDSWINFEINVTVATNAHARDLLRYSAQFETLVSICSYAIVNIFTTVSGTDVKQLPIEFSR